MTPLEIYRSEILPRLTAALVYGDGLRQHGSERRGPCLIHNGKHFNFAVNAETLDWYCHSKCARGGDPIEYVKLTQGLAFGDAIAHLADLVGVELPGRRSAGPRLPRSPTRPIPIRPIEKPAPDRAVAHQIWGAARAVLDNPRSPSTCAGGTRIRRRSRIATSADSFPSATVPCPHPRATGPGRPGS